MSTLLPQILKERTGFEACEMDGSPETCEKCGKPTEELYYRKTDYFSADGDYWCLQCALLEAMDRVREEERQTYPVYEARGKQFRFNDVVRGMTTGVEGRLVQVRCGCGQFGSDVYFLRRRDGTLHTVENDWLERVDDDSFPPGPDHPMVTYTIEEKWPETGFIVEKPSQPATPGSFRLTVQTNP